MIVRSLFACALVAFAVLPAGATGQAVSYNIVDYTGALSDCQVDASVAFSNASFKNVSTVKSKTGKTGAVFADIGIYQGIIVCDPPHKSAVITVVGSNQPKTLTYVTKITNAFLK